MRFGRTDFRFHLIRPHAIPLQRIITVRLYDRYAARHVRLNHMQRRHVAVLLVRLPATFGEHRYGRRDRRSVARRGRRLIVGVRVLGRIGIRCVGRAQRDGRLVAA